MSKARQNDSGFTLVELMVVMSILTILMGLSAYALLPYMRSQALTSTTNEILTDFRDAQVRAQGEVRTYCLIFDVGNSSYEIRRINVSKDVNGNPVLCTGIAPDVSILERRELPRGVALSVADFGPDASTAYFYARGTSSGGRLVIISTALNQDREIQLTALTAKAKVV